MTKPSWTLEQRAIGERAYAERRALYVGPTPEHKPWKKKVDELVADFWEEIRRTAGETKPRARLRALLEFLCGEHPRLLFGECDKRLAKKKKKQLTPDQEHELRLGVITRIDRLDSLVDTLRCHVESAQIVEMILTDMVPLLSREGQLANLLWRNIFEDERDKENGRKSQAKPRPETEERRRAVTKKVEAVLAANPDLTGEEVWDRVWADGAIRKLGVRNTVRTTFNIAIQKLVNEPPH